MRSALRALLLACGALVALGGCAGAGEATRDPRDPFEPANRVLFRVNDIGDRYLAEPVARAYRKATPGAFRIGANNFLENLRYPITFVNQFLQGKFGQGGEDLARFVLNSTVGLAGVFDPATAVGLEAHDEDFGQTLAVWGVPEGPYFMVPVFGPYTLTHGAGELIDTQFSLLVEGPSSSLTTKLGLWYLVQKRYRLLGTEDQWRTAYDPYLFIRDAYFQNRRYKIFDGNPPEEDLFPEDEFEE